MKRTVNILCIALLFTSCKSMPLSPEEELEMREKNACIEQRNEERRNKIKSLTLQKSVWWAAGISGSLIFIINKQYISSLAPAGFAFAINSIINRRIEISRMFMEKTKSIADEKNKDLLASQKNLAKQLGISNEKS